MARAPVGDTDVLVVGAGPTGLVLALWLTHLGVRVRIVDKTSEPATTSRAIAVQARTLELYRQIGIADMVVQRGRPATGVNLWSGGRQVARAVFGDIGTSLTPYPYVLIFSQDEHERLLIERLDKLNISVERCTELLDFEQTDSGVSARLKRPDGWVDTCEAAWLAGCDGAHSSVRETLSIGFPGGTYEHRFYVADVDASGAAVNGEVHVALDRADFLALFPMPGDRRVRLVGTIREEAGREPDDLTWEDVSRRVIDWMRIDVERVNWFSTYRVHHRVADQFRSGRAFLLGDAAHIHSPVGGQGMNTGIGDAVNLAWKLASVVNGSAPAAMLDTYETERRAFARRLVATTDQAFVAVTSSRPIAQVLRLHVVPFLVPLVFAVPAARRLLFRVVSQMALNYRGSHLSEGRAGPVRGGDRLPWSGTDSTDNFAPLTSLEWQVHVYGNAPPVLQTVCREHHLPLHVFPWLPHFDRTGLRRDAIYLVRPDGHVALADPDGRATAIASFLTAHQLVLKPWPGAASTEGR